MDKKKIENAMRDILIAIGEDPDREGIKDTPKRVAKMYEEIFGGIGKNPEDELSVFHNVEHNEMVIVKNISIYSMCEHHFVPFFGKAHVCYIPKNNRITGLSKIARVVDVVSKKPQLQERLTKEIADALMKKLKPLGVMVIIEAEHMCMSMRGIKKPESITMTSAVRGIFKEMTTRMEAMNLIKK